MNNLRKSTVMLFIGVFVVSMLMVPFMPIASVDSPVSQALPQAEQEFIQKWADRVENDMVGEKMDPMLVSYMETGVIDESMYRNLDGSIKLLLYVAPGFDSYALNNIADINWQIDLVVSRVASVSVNSVIALRQLEAMDGIAYVQADRFIDRTINSAPGEETDMFNIIDNVGASDAIALGYDGSGAIVGVDDTGVDFSHPDLVGTEYNNGTYAMSYDPSSVGLTMMYVANGSYVANTTAWLEAGNLLTYNGTDGNMYVDVTGWDPVCNNGGGYRTLISGFIGIYENAWGIANASEYVNSMLWKDWQIPDPIGGKNYTFGWAFQQRQDGYAKVFAPSMIFNGNVIIDWNGTYAWTNMWMDAFWWESADLTATADRAYYAGLMDWSFNDDIAAGYTHGGINNVLAADLDDDGVNDVGLGSLSWAYDDLGYLDGDYGVFYAVTPDWLGWNCLFNSETPNHGMWTTAAIAGQGIWDYEVYDNTTITTTTTTTVVDGKTVTTITEVEQTSVYKLPGVANGSKIIFTKGLSTGSGIMADFWAAGFHLNESAGQYGNLTYWEYTADGATHHADMVSNSWGWGPGGSYLQLYYYALMYDMASVPNVLGTGYPGTLFIFSAGNNGNDYGTTGTPGGSYSVVSVGASTTSHFYESLYGNTQTDGQQVYFSATGPGFTGIVKPDVMAPGYRGASPQPFQNIWLDAGATYYWWQGTSLSCPVAAGVAAIIIDAYMQTHSNAKPSPQYVKNVLLSTATDMGIDPFAQGHGLVNALAAVNAIAASSTGDYIFESESYKYFGDQVAEAWNWWAYDFDWNGIYMPSPVPVGMESSSIFFGSVSRSDIVHVNLTATDFAGTAAQTGTFSSLPVALMMDEAQVISFPLTSAFYNDTNFNPKIVRPKSFDLEAAMEVASAGSSTAFRAATYATIQVSFTAANTGTVVRLFDWSDDILSGDLNYWNFKTGVGDIVDHVSRATDPCNLLTMRIGDPMTLGHLFNDGVAALQLDAAKAGVVATVTITLWDTLEVDTAISISDQTGYMDVQLTVPGSAEYGIHQGQIVFVDGTWSHKVPYSYMVDFDMTSSYGTNQTLVNGVGATHTPYDTGATTTAFISGSTRTDEAGGIDVFRVNIPYDITLNASIVVIRAEWQNKGTVIDFQVRNLLNGVEAATTNLVPTADKANVVVWDYEDLVNGSYWFLVYTHAFNGASVPEDIKITFQLFNATTFAAATYVNEWASRTSSPAFYNDTDVLVGDHVTINNNWTVPAVTGLPEYVIEETKIALLSGLYVTMTGTYPDPLGVDAWPVGLGLTIYNWETVEGITAGDNVRVAIDAQGGQDPAFDVWNWDDVNDDGIVDEDTELGSTSLLSVDNGGGGTSEAGAYTAAVSGDIAIRVYAFAYAWHSGVSYVLTVDTRASVDIWSDANPEFAEFDTYELRRNITMTVQFYCYTGTDVMFYDELGSVSFMNYFAPSVTVNTPVSLGSNRWNLTWSSTDQNADDVPYYSLWLSRDAGVTYVLLQQNLTATNYTWNSVSWLQANYIVRVRAYSCDFTNWTTLGYTDGIICDVGNPPSGYWPGDFADAFSGTFAAGAVPPVTTTTTTTTTTNTTTTITTTVVPPPPLDPLLIGLLGGIGVGVVVLLILFLVRKK